MGIDKKNWLGIHVALWCFMVLFVFDYHWFETSWWKALGYSGMEVLGYILLFYANTFMIKKLDYQKNSGFKKIIATSLLIVFYAIVIKKSGLEELFYEGSEWRNLFSIIMNAVLFVGLSYLLYTSKKYIETREKNLELLAENRKMQLDNLKARINPHFIFNTLNNMYALIIKKDEKVSSVVSKLSSVLRYAVDSDSSQHISIQKETDHLKDYIELIKLQEPLAENIDFYQEGDFNNYKIIPFVLISFLENAIKHGDIMQNSEGLLHIDISMEDEFVFEIKNSTINKKISSLGEGLYNVERQLNLAYGNACSLEKKLENNLFTLMLKINANKMSVE